MPLKLNAPMLRALPMHKTSVGVLLAGLRVQRGPVSSKLSCRSLMARGLEYSEYGKPTEVLDVQERDLARYGPTEALVEILAVRHAHVLLA